MNNVIKIMKITTVLFAIVLIIYFLNDTIRINRANKKFSEEMERIDELNGHKIIIRGYIFFADSIKKDTLK